MSSPVLLYYTPCKTETERGRKEHLKTTPKQNRGGRTEDSLQRGTERVVSFEGEKENSIMTQADLIFSVFYS